MCQDERIKEACGVFGIYNPHGEDAASSIYYGLSSLQHRGQESCGIAVFDTSGPKGNMNVQRGMGLVSEVFKEDVLSNMKGNLGIGHVRYSTTGAATLSNAQPLVLNYIKRKTEPFSIQQLIQRLLLIILPEKESVPNRSRKRS